MGELVKEAAMSERTDGWAKGEMRLSGAIRIGAMMHEQAYGRSMEKDADGNIMKTCALGAAVIAIGHEQATEEVKEQLGLYNRVRHPMNKFPMTMGHVIASLNDDYRWTRSAIADWVEQEENKEIERYEQAVREEHEWQSKRENNLAARSNDRSVVGE
jgi:hypothetical protein